MFDVSKLFGKGDKNTLLMKNGLNFSYNGPSATVEEGLVLDRFHLATFCSAEYTISIDYDTNNKEIIRALVVGSPSNSSVTIYGRSNLGNDLVKLTSTVTDSFVELKLDPENKTATTKYNGSKAIFKATYFQTMNALLGGV